MPLTPADARDALRETIGSLPIGKRWIDRERLAGAISQLLDVKVASGQHVTVTAADTIDTGLAKVNSALASFEDDPDPGAFLVTAQVGDQAGSPAAGRIIIKTFYLNGIAIDPAVTFGLKINWIAIAA